MLCKYTITAEPSYLELSYFELTAYLKVKTWSLF